MRRTLSLDGPVDRQNTLPDSRRRDLGELLSARLRDLAAAGGDRHRQRRLLVQDLTDLVARLGGERPLLVVLEDLHWADQLSLEVAGHLAARLAGRAMLVAGAYRSDELYPRVPMREWRARLLTQRLAEEVRLPRLTMAQTAVMTSAVLGRAAPASVVAAIHDRGDGISLHAEELLAAIRPDLGGIASIPVPDTLADAVLARAATLDATSRQVAQAAAVIGRSFEFELLTAAAELGPPEPAPREHAALLVAIGDEAAATDDNVAALAAYEDAHRLLTGAGDTLEAAAVVAKLVPVAHLLGEDLASRAGRLERALASVPDGPGTELVRAALLSALAAAYMLDRRLDAGDRLRRAEPRPRRGRRRRRLPGHRRHPRLGAGVRRPDGRGVGDAGGGRRRCRRPPAGGGGGPRLPDDRLRQLGPGRVRPGRALARARGRLRRSGRDVEPPPLHGRPPGPRPAQGERMAELQRFSPALWGLAETALLRGDHDTAVALCDRGRAASARVGDAAYLFPFLLTGLRARLARGEVADAERWLTEVAGELAARSIPGTLAEGAALATEARARAEQATASAVSPRPTACSRPPAPAGRPAPGTP
jgi:hypothetical protein